MYDTAYTHDSGKDIMPARSNFHWDDVSAHARIEIKEIGEINMRRVSDKDWTGEYRDGNQLATVDIVDFNHEAPVRVSGTIQRTRPSGGETDDMGSFVGTKTY